MSDVPIWDPSDEELALMTDDELAIVAEYRATLEASDLQDKQQLAEALADEADELLFGGAAFSGKTWWGIEHVIEECVRHPGNRALILRRVWPSLRRDMLPRLKVRLHQDARWHGGDKTFTFKNGSVLELGHLQFEDSWTAYQGASYGVIFFEELTEFLETQFEQLRPWCRVPPSAVGPIRPHVVATTNPGGVGHRWVKRRFVRAEDGTARPTGRCWIAEGEEAMKRAFVPATSKDNPRGIERDPNYMARLRASVSNRGLRRAFEHGDWDAIDLVERALWQWQSLDGGRVSEGTLNRIGATRRAVAVDPSDGLEAGNEYGVWAGGMGNDGVIYTTRSFPLLASPRTMAEQTLEVYRETRADVLLVERNHGGKWLTTVFKMLDPYVNIEEVWASEGKRTRAEPVAALFEFDPDGPIPYRARLEGRHPEAEEEMTTFTGEKGEASPNVLDALVWGHAGLMGARESVFHIPKNPLRVITGGPPGRMRAV